MKPRGPDFFPILFVILLLGTHSSAGPKLLAQTISIKGMKFNPDKIEINAGETIVWKNEDIVPHTVTDKGVFDSGALAADKSYKFKFAKKGSYSYGCSFHPTMKAVITVK